MPPPIPPAKTPYKKLKGRHRGLLSTSTMYRGPDHYLFVESPLRLVENYKRFYFSEITGLQIYYTRYRMFWNLFGFLVLAAFAAAWNATRYDNPYFWGILLAIPLTGILINSLKGPMCKVYLYTDYRRHDLRQYSRVRKAKKFQQDVVESVESLQGKEFSKNPAEALAGYSAPVLSGDAADAVPVPKRGSRFLMVTALVFCMACAVDAYWIIQPVAGFVILKGVLLVASFFLTIVALIRQGVLGPVKAAMQWLVGSLGYHLLLITFLYIISVPVWLKVAVDSNSQHALDLMWAIIEAIASQPAVYLYATVATAFISLFFGVVGVRISMRLRKVSAA